MRTLLLGLAALCLLAFTPAKPTTPPAGGYFYQGTFDNALRLARKQKKQVLLDFWASWCAPCQKMDRETFKDSQLAAFLSENYIVYRVDVDTPDGAAIAHRFYVSSYPSLAILNSRGQFQRGLKGFFPATHLLNYLQTDASVYTSAEVFSMNN